MTSSRDEHEAQILRSWHINASPWSRAIRDARIASREGVTNRAVLEAMNHTEALIHAEALVHAEALIRTPAQHPPLRVLDVGCGEGWLSRALEARGMRVVGIDAVPELVAEARHMGGGDFRALDYATIARRQWDAGPFDAAVCNFSLLGKESVAALLAGLPWYLANPGYLIIQTLHPIAACGNEPYQDGWRAGNWCGFSSDFSNPAPWYFRTVESWRSLLANSGFELVDCREPTAAIATVPSSIIWICKSRGAAQT
jgi:SAM-dependent methyltransferase